MRLHIQNNYIRFKLNPNHFFFNLNETKETFFDVFILFCSSLDRGQQPFKSMIHIYNITFQNVM